MTNKDIEDNIDEIFKYVGDNGYHENRGARVDCDSCKRVEKAKSRVTALISQLENEARKVTGETSDGKSIQPLLVQFIGDAKANVQD